MRGLGPLRGLLWRRGPARQAQEQPRTSSSSSTHPPTHPSIYNPQHLIRTASSSSTHPPTHPPTHTPSQPALPCGGQYQLPHLLPRLVRHGRTPHAGRLRSSWDGELGKGFRAAERQGEDREGLYGALSRSLHAQLWQHSSQNDCREGRNLLPSVGREEEGKHSPPTHLPRSCSPYRCSFPTHPPTHRLQ